MPDHRVQGRCRYSPVTIKNFNRWITIEEVPSDDELRYCLSTVSTTTLNDLLKKFHSQIERRKLLINEPRLLGLELVVLDGTGQISSTKIACEKCLTRDPATGERLHMHGQLLASLTNLRATYALPLQFEPIERSDTEIQYSKNDCELNAAKRLIQKMKTEFPKRSFCFLGDNLFAVEPMATLILEKGWHFIFTAKPERNIELFYMFDYAHEKKKTLTTKDPEGLTHCYTWSNQLPIKQAKFKEPVLQVNLLTYELVDADGVLL